MFLAAAQPYIKESLQGGLTPTGLDLIAMIVSDAGLASSEPQWWNASVPGCILIGLQPRGGWQVMQRTVQWGDDHLASIFGVTCTKPVLYAYFACSMRNRIERWDSPAWNSPMEGQKAEGAWQVTGRSHVKRPGKLVDGSRGGQGFICSLLRPKDAASYTIVEQARMQFRSIILVAAGLMHSESLEDVELIMRKDFQLSDGLGVIFRPLLVGLIIANILVIALSVAVFYAIFHNNIFGNLVSFVVKACSLSLWAVGAIGLLMLGGHPRVKIVEADLPDHIMERLAKLDEKKSEEGDVQIEFGSTHGPVYTAGCGHCTLPIDVVQKICRWDLELKRPIRWKIGFTWWSLCLLLSITMQFTGAQVSTLAAEIFSVAILMVASLARGYGVAGPEAWLIPRWKSRRMTAYGAALVGKMESRAAAG
jgi:hypothetical protein